MKKQEILKSIENDIYSGSLKAFDKNIGLLFEIETDFEASKQLATIIAKQYTRFKADMLAKFMEIILRKKPSIGLTNFPDNFLFRVSIIKGSKDLYDCFVEESILPAIKELDEDDKSTYFAELLNIAEGWTAQLFDNYAECVKGMDYNGAFSRYEKNESVALIHQEDYETMESIMEHFNAIVGRRDIIKDLEDRI